jgi:hypothetical protein
MPVLPDFDRWLPIIEDAPHKGCSPFFGKDLQISSVIMRRDRHMSLIAAGTTH